MKKFFRIILQIVAAGIIFLILLFIYNTKIIESGNSLSVAPETTKFLDIGDEKIAYSEINNNAQTTVVFIGGLSAWNGTWERVVQELNRKKNEFNYIAIDLPPFGYSVPAPKSQYTRDTQAERIAKFIEGKNIKKLVFIAHSYGAGPAMEYALQNQEKVEKVILVDAVLNIDEIKTIPRFGPVQLNFLRDFLIGVLIHNDTFTLSQFKKFVYRTDRVDRELLSVYTRSFDTKYTTKRLSTWLRDYVNDPLNHKSNSSDDYKDFSVPVRLIWGDKDTITPIEGTDILLNIVPDIRLVTMSGVGHIPMIEDPKEFDTVLLELLDALDK